MGPAGPELLQKKKKNGKRGEGLLVSDKTKRNKTITHTLHPNTAADVRCLHSGETFKLNICVKTVEVCVSDTFSCTCRCKSQFESNKTMNCMD